MLPKNNLSFIPAPIENAEKAFPLRMRLQTIPFVDKILFIRHLEVMARTGFSITDALRVIARQTENLRFKSVVGILATDVEAGKNLSASMQKFPHVFAEVVLNIVQAGEESGEMSDLLQRLAVHMKKVHTLRSKIRSAMIYPSVVLVAMVAVSIVTITFVIPRMNTLFESSGVALPLPTRILIAISDLLINQGQWFALAAIAAIIGLIQAFRKPKTRLWIDRHLLMLPIFGSIIQKTNIANFTRTLSAFLKTDIPIVKTFAVVSMTLGNHYYRQVINEASEKLRKGISVSSVLLEYPKLFPPMVSQIFVTGEATGTLDTIITEIAEFYDADVDETLGNLSTIIEPVLILVLGAGVAGLAVAVLLPMMSLSSVV